MIDFNALRAEFPKEDIHWRAQSLTRDGTKALALAYIDARNVMERLDAVCGPDGWQDRYEETPKGRVICTLSLRIGEEWISKSDGAGTTDVEGDKGAVSDALKRAAVKWGIGRYLYSMPSVWAPCESYESGGKKKWKDWKGDIWQHVKNAPKLPQLGDPANDAPADEPANDPPKDEPAPREKLEGKHSCKTALKKALEGVVAKLRLASSTREIDAIVAEYAADLEQGVRYLPKWMDGDPTKDWEGINALVNMRRDLIWLIEGLRANDNIKDRDHWYAANETAIEQLEDKVRREFDTAFEQHEAGLKLVANANA